MFQNRISELLAMPFELQPPQGASSGRPTGSLADLLSMTASTLSLYQAASALAVRDHELNKLFNPDYYHLGADGDEFSTDDE